MTAESVGGDRPDREGQPISWLDRQFVNASGCAMVVLALLLNGVAVVLGLLGLIFCKHPKARQHALVVFVAGLAFTILGVLLVIFAASQGG